MSKGADSPPLKAKVKPVAAIAGESSEEEPQAQSSQLQTADGPSGSADFLPPPCVYHADAAGRDIRHCVLMNNGVWMPMIGIGVCKGNAAMIEQVVEDAVLAGYRHIDTTFAAHSETAIGNALRKVMASGKVKREELFIVTKLPCEGNCRKKVRKYLFSSLKKLQLTFVDLYLIHFPVYERAFKKNHHRPHQNVGSQMEELQRCAMSSPKPAGSETMAYSVESPDSPVPEDESGSSARDVTDILETWRGMEDAANMGLTRSIGLCNFNKDQITRILNVARIKPANLQVECHAYLNQKDLVEFCKEHSISISAYAPLGSPASSGLRSPSPKENPGESFHTHSDLLRDETVKKIADSYKKTPAQVLIRWLLQRGIVVLPRSTCLEHIRENIQVFSFELSDADCEILSSLDKNLRLFTYDVHGLPSRAEYPFK